MRPPLRSTYTYVILEVTPELYREVREKLAAAGYEHTFHANDEGELIDMHGIALRAEPEPATRARHGRRLASDRRGQMEPR